MEQKEINYRIAMSMLMQCAITWELCTKCKVQGEILLSDVLKMCENIVEGRKHTRMVQTEVNYCRYPDVLYKKLALVPGVAGYVMRRHMVHLFINTSDTDPKQGFSCGYPIKNVFVMCYQFCRRNGYPSLLKKAVFGKDADGMYACIPEWKLPKATKQPSVKVSAKPATPAPKISIREAVMDAVRMLKQQTA